MADCAFNWCEMENDLCNPEYSKNYFRTNKLNWDDIKERHPENIWLIRKKDHKFWLLGRLAVDVDKKISPPRKSEKFWITFDPSKSTFYSDPLIISNELAETLGSVCGRIFRKGNGIGVNAATMLDPGEESVMKKADARNNKISLHDFAAKIKAGIISGTPYQKSVTATKPRTGKASENPNPPENE
ncbi:MAG: hypothetical protein ABI475_08840, partial [Methylophilaceae bacterium]